MLLAGSIGKNSPLKAIFPMVAANDIYRDTSFMGGLVDSEFERDLHWPRLDGLATNMANPVGDAFEDTRRRSSCDPVATSPAIEARPRERPCRATTPQPPRRTCSRVATRPYDESSTRQDRNPQNMIHRIVANNIPAFLVGGEFDLFQRGERSTTTPSCRTRGTGAATRACRSPRQRTTGRYQLIDGPWEHLNGSSVDVDPLELEWFDTWLKHERTGMARTAHPLHYYDLGTEEFLG